MGNLPGRGEIGKRLSEAAKVGRDEFGHIRVKEGIVQVKQNGQCHLASLKRSMMGGIRRIRHKGWLHRDGSFYNRLKLLFVFQTPETIVGFPGKDHIWAGVGGAQYSVQGGFTEFQVPVRIKLPTRRHSSCHVPDNNHRKNMGIPYLLWEFAYLPRG